MRQDASLILKISNHLLKKTQLIKYIISILIVTLLFTTGCAQRKKLPEKTFSQAEFKKIDETYHHYRENFFKYYLDEGKNRFNGCVPEKIYIPLEKLSQNNYLEGYQKIKFADATIYASMALMFLSNDVKWQLSQGNQKEAMRSSKLLRQVMDGIISNDKLSLAGLDGFFLRDTVDNNIEGLKVESDFLNTKGGANEMSGSQSSGLYYGFHFSLVTLGQIKNANDLGLDTVIVDIKKELELLTRYLVKNKFRIQSEINPGKRSRRGPYVFTLKWVYFEINRYWNDSKRKNPYCKALWTLMFKGTNYFCKNNKLSVKNYSKLKESTPKNYHGKTYAPLYCQMLQAAFLSMRKSRCDLIKWKKYVWRYQNGLAVSSAMVAGIPLENKFKNMVYQQLLDAPSNHLPNNFSKDHFGWNSDNRWIRLLHRNKMPDQIKEVQVYNGLDFLCVYSAIRSQLK